MNGPETPHKIRLIPLEIEPSKPSGGDEATPLVTTSSTTAAAATEPKKELSPIGMMMVVFFLVCGGAYGTEDLASTMPPFYSLLTLFFLPWLWSVPVALITAELTLAVPHDAAFIEWTRLAFGQFASRVEASIITLVCVLDQAVYPKIFVAYITQVFTFELVFWQEYLVYVAFVVVTLIIVLFGVSAIEKASYLLYLVTILPFIIFILVGFSVSTFDTDVWFRRSKSSPNAPSDFGLFLSVLVWATCGYEYSGTLVSSLKDPVKTYPRVVVVSVIVVTLTYLLPLMITLGTYPDYEHLVDGDYPAIARNLGAGDWLGYVMMAGGITSSAGTYMSYLSTSSTALGAKTGKNSKIFMVVLSLTTCALVPVDFGDLIEFEMLLFAIHIAFLSGSFFVLRLRRKDIDRPFNAFGKSMISAGALATMPMIIVLVSLWFKDVVVLAIGVVILLTIVCGVFLYSRYIEPRLYTKV